MKRNTDGTFKSGNVGKDCPGWKGGVYHVKTGYNMLYAPNHPRINKNKKKRFPYVFEHIIVMERKLGRFLVPKKEIVHHINGIKNDNREENLIVVTRAEHNSIHNKKIDIDRDLLRKAYIEEDLSQLQVSDRLKCSLRTITKRIREYKLYKKGPYGRES